MGQKQEQFIDGKKVYTSKSGRQFAVVQIARPAVGTVVFFTDLEFDWIKRQNLQPAEFDCLWELKRDDFQYYCIPDEEILEPARLAKKYAPGILAGIRKGQQKPSSPDPIPSKPSPMAAVLDAVPPGDLQAVLYGRKPWPQLPSGNEQQKHAAAAPGLSGQNAQGPQGSPKDKTK